MLVLVLIGIIVPKTFEFEFLITCSKFVWLSLVLFTKIEIDVKRVVLVLVF